MSLITLLFSVCTMLHAQPEQVVLEQKDGSITFALDEVDPPTDHCGILRSGSQWIAGLNLSPDTVFSEWTPEILANSLADVGNLYDIGEDVLFQMLLKAWCQHRPVVLSPDAIWLVICQQVSHCINDNPEQYRPLLVNHEGKKELKVRSEDLFSDQPDWTGLMARFASEIDKYTNKGIAETLLADFSTTGPDELIASEVTLMDVVKPFFEYTAAYAVCGIPSITLTGTPEDWRKVLYKTRSLDVLGFGWWISDLEPILEEFVKAAEGNPDYWFWKDIVKKSRPRTIQGPTCMNNNVKLTKFDGWFLKFFPYDNKGRTPSEVTLTQTMLSETVAVPFKYQVETRDGVVLSETPLELVAGIMGVLEDPFTYAMTPKIGWFVRTVNAEGVRAVCVQGLSMDSSLRYWDEGPLTWEDLGTRSSELPKISAFEYGFFSQIRSQKVGNTVIRSPYTRSYMNPFTSWVHPDSRTPIMLQYIQTGFDYVEICRRRAQVELVAGAGYRASIVQKFHLDVADSFLAKMKDETQQGLDTAAVRYFSRRVKNELAWLDDDPAPAADLCIYPKGFSMGLHVGAGSEFYMGPMAVYVTPVTGLGFGFDLTFNRISILLDGLLGWGGKYKKDIPRDGYQWDAGKRVKGGNMELSLGYTAYDSQWWKVVPFMGVGAGFLEYPFHPGDPEKNSDEISGFRIQGGISTDYKFRRIVDRSSSSRSLAETSVRVRLYAAHSAYPSPAPAWTVNLGIGVNWLSWILTL